MADEQRVKGAGKKTEGSIKETAGKALGDEELEAEGKADKAEGHARSTVGHMKDAAREAVGKKS